MVVALKLRKLNKEDSKLREDLIVDAISLIESEKIKVPKYSKVAIAEFALSWPGLRGSVSSQLRRALSGMISDVSVLDWIDAHYSIKRLGVFYRFSTYCDWLSPKEIIEHFGDILKIFMAIQGDAPNWCSVPYHNLLQKAYVQLARKYRNQFVREWLRDHWSSATRFFDGDGKPLNFPYEDLIDLSFVYTQYCAVGLEIAKEYVKNHPEAVERVLKRAGSLDFY